MLQVFDQLGRLCHEIRYSLRRRGFFKDEERAPVDLMAQRKVRSCYRVRRGVSKKLGWAAVFSAVVPWLPSLIGAAAGLPGLMNAGMVVGFLGLLLGAGLALAAPLVNFVQSRAPALVAVESGDLVYLQGEKRRSIPRNQIVGGVVVPSPKNATLEVYLKDGDLIRIAVDDARTGDAILDELGIGATNRRARIDLADDSRKLLVALPRLVVTALFWFMMLGMAVQQYQAAFGHKLPGTFMGPWLACLVGTFLLWQRLARPASIEVGSDGVTIKRALEERFLPHASTARVWAHGKQVFFSDTSGTLTSVGGSLAQAGAEDGAHAAPTALAAVYRIEEARRAAGGEQVPEQLAAQLDHDGRSVESWRRDLEDVMAPGAGYRSAALSPDDVEKVLADPYAPIDRRIGAAVALTAARVPGAPERIRVAAGATSNDELRNALEKVADGRTDQQAEDEAIAEAVQAAEKQAEKQR